MLVGAWVRGSAAELPECTNQGCLAQYNVTPTALFSHYSGVDGLLEATSKTARALAAEGYDALSAGASSAVSVLMRRPLSTLYFHGPSLGGWGFWAGKRPADICADLTQVPASAWHTRMTSECAELLNRHFESFFVAVIMLLYAVCSYHAVSAFWFRVTVVSPLMRDVRMALRRRVRYPTTAHDEEEEAGDTTVAGVQR